MRPRLSVATVLERGMAKLLARAEALEARVAGGQDVWAAYQDTLRTIVALQGTPERAGAMLTTTQMAAHMQIRPKSLLRKVKRGELKPAVRRGRMIRWRGTEATG